VAGAGADAVQKKARGSDGFAGANSVHADLAWPKLRTLVEGARVASKSPWP
jgi:hypothetical protein